MFPLPESGANDAPARYKVLVVDDEPTLRLGFSYALADHDTDTASGGREALEKIEGNDYDIVILDLRMPDIDGLQVVSTLRREENPLPVVICSAAITASAALRAITGNVVDFLLKPVCPAELRGVIDYVMNPGQDPLSLAMVEARAGRMDEAVHVLEGAPEHSKTTASWLRIMRAIRVATLEGEAAAFSQLEREGLNDLAFKVP